MIDDFNREVHILSSLRYLKDPNIINLITAYQKGQTHNFLFPFAGCDLTDLLGSSSGLTGFRTQIEIVASLWGLSSALEKMHKFYVKELNIEQVGCNYDIKPRNILCLEALKASLYNQILGSLSCDKGKKDLDRISSGEKVAI